MPKMNGIDFLKNLMRLRPMPVVMVSTLTQMGAPATLTALELGAVDFVGKPKGAGGAGIGEYRDEIIDKVVAAASANLSAPGYSAEQVITPLGSPSHSGRQLRPDFICAIGASTGGTEAIKDVLMAMPEDCPPIVIAQHIPEAFSASFAERLNNTAALKVYEARDGQPIERGAAYIAPGHSHLRVIKGKQGYVCKLDKGELVNRHRPAVDVLFESVNKVAGSKSMAVILTGMGADGAKQMLAMRQAGCVTVAQDEASSVVWGMPGAAVKLEAATKVLPLAKVAKFILHNAYSNGRD